MNLKDKINSLFQDPDQEDDQALVGDDTAGVTSDLTDVENLPAQSSQRLPFLGRLLKSESRQHEAQANTAYAPSARATQSNRLQPRHEVIEEEVLAAVGPRPKPLMLIGDLTPKNQYVVGGTLAAALLAAGVIVGFIGTRAASFDLERVSIATRVQMLSQRLAGAAQLSLQGEMSAVNKMRTSKDDLVQAMDLLTLGNIETGMGGLSRERFDSLLSLDTNTRALRDKISTLISLSTSLVHIEDNAAKLNSAASAMFQDASQLHSIAHSNATASPHQLAAVDQLRLLSERIYRQGIVLLRSPNVTSETLAHLVSDAADARAILEQLRKGDKALALSPLAGAANALQSLDDSLRDVDAFVSYVEKHSNNIVAARQGQKALDGLSDSILRDATRLTEQLADATASDRNVQLASVLLLFGAMLSMLVLALVNIRLARIDAWHEAVRNRQAQIEASRSAERNQRNELDMIELMTDISALELGDLTVDYTNNLAAMEGIAGSVRSSVNEGVIALRNAVITVKETAGKVLSLVGVSVDSTRALEQSNEKQSSEIEDVVTAVTNLVENIGRVTDRTLLAARIAAEGKGAAAEGSTVVVRLEQAMAQIRILTQDVLKSVKKSGETSQEILEINDAIESITDRTSIIALNAEMEAARAGAAGAPIKVLAAEVARLAENSKQLQATIGALAQRNQGETAATIKLVEDSASAVVEGARLSSQANAELFKIAEKTTTIAGIMSEIEDTAKSQAENAHTVTEKMVALSALSQQFQSSVSNVVHSVAEIDESMGNLKQTVDQFRTDPEAE